MNTDDLVNEIVTKLQPVLHEYRVCRQAKEEVMQALIHVLVLVIGEHCRWKAGDESAYWTDAWKSQLIDTLNYWEEDTAKHRASPKYRWRSK